MAFSDFTYPSVLTEFGLTERGAYLFPGVPPVAPSAAFNARFDRNTQLAVLINTEKARSEYLIAPVLGELWEPNTRIGLHSGVEFPADPEARLTGFCDFILGHGPQVPRVHAPVLMVVEAKNEKISDGYGQCIAAMVGAVRFNRREGTEVPAIYGCVTSGMMWRFLRLTDGVVTFDLNEYTLAPVDRILGILTHIIGPLPQPAAA